MKSNKNIKGTGPVPGPGVPANGMGGNSTFPQEMNSMMPMNCPTGPQVCNKGSVLRVVMLIYGNMVIIYMN